MKFLLGFAELNEYLEYVEVVTLLLQNGCDFTCRNFSTESALHRTDKIHTVVVLDVARFDKIPPFDARSHVFGTVGNELCLVGIDNSVIIASEPLSFVSLRDVFCLFRFTVLPLGFDQCILRLIFCLAGLTELLVKSFSGFGTDGREIESCTHLIPLVCTLNIEKFKYIVND